MTRLERFIIFSLCLILVLGIAYAPVWHGSYTQSKKTTSESSWIKIQCQLNKEEYMACWAIDRDRDRFFVICALSTVVGLAMDDSTECYEDGIGVMTVREYKRMKHAR